MLDNPEYKTLTTCSLYEEQFISLLDGSNFNNRNTSAKESVNNSTDKSISEVDNSVNAASFSKGDLNKLFYLRQVLWNRFYILPARLTFLNISALTWASSCSFLFFNWASFKILFAKVYIVSLKKMED